MWSESMATIKVHKPDLHKDCSREPWCWDNLPGDTSALLLLSSETEGSEYSTKQVVTYHSTKLEGLESWPGWVDRLLRRLVQRHLLVHHENVVHVELQRVQTPCIVGVSCICICRQNLPAVHLDGGQGLEGDAHHLVEADPGQVGRHALDARPEGLRVIQVLNFKISQLLASKLTSLP